MSLEWNDESAKKAWHVKFCSSSLSFSLKERSRHNGRSAEGIGVIRGRPIIEEERRRLEEEGEGGKRAHAVKQSYLILLLG